MVSRMVGGEILIVPAQAKVGELASVYSFNETGFLIWKLLEAPRTSAELSAAVAVEYDVARERAEQDVAQFLSDMFLAGLVEMGAVPEVPGKPKVATAGGD
jgi:hypothetical protein